MKYIYFFRHSDSPLDINTPDHDRPLSKLGVEKAMQMAGKVKNKLPLPELFISSSAKRALQTCQIIRNQINKDIPISEYREIYTGGKSEISKIIRTIGNDRECISIFGHNPTMQKIYNIISKKSTLSYQPCGMMLANLPSKAWKRFSFTSLELKVYEFPEIT